MCVVLCALQEVSMDERSKSELTTDVSTQNHKRHYFPNFKMLALSRKITCALSEELLESMYECN